MRTVSPVERLAERLRGLPQAELHDALRRSIGPLSLAERFDLLHRLGIYHHEETLSGAASTLRETAALRTALPRLVAERGISSLLDIPCGDFHWLREVPLDADYTGADVVPALVGENQRRYGSARRRFSVLDATRDALPRTDLILCRDLFIHLSLADCLLALRNFARSSARWFLTNHFADRTGNPDILSGDFRPVNLCRPPFSLPPPLEVIDERSALAGGEFADRAMALWALDDVRSALSAAPPNTAGGTAPNTAGDTAG